MSNRPTRALFSELHRTVQSGPKLDVAFLPKELRRAAGEELGRQVDIWLNAWVRGQVLTLMRRMCPPTLPYLRRFVKHLGREEKARFEKLRQGRIDAGSMEPTAWRLAAQELFFESQDAKP